MRPVFETCVPRAEVLSGELKDEMFAVRSRDILEVPAVNTQTLLRAIENVLDREPTGTFCRKRGEVPADLGVFDSVAIAELNMDAPRLGLSSARHG